MASADCRAKVCNATCRQRAADGSLADALNAQNTHDRTILASQAVPATSSLPMGRIASIEHLRIVAAVGIVWFHTEGTPCRQIGYAGLPIFLLIFFSLITRDFGTTTTHFLHRRWDRLLKPWLFWSGVYGVCSFAKATLTMDPTGLWGMLTLRTLFTGTSIHLWYLPYAFVAGGTAIPYGIGVPLVCVAYCVEIKGNILVATLAPLTFGVYLVHPLVIYGLRHLLPLTGHHVLFISSVACLSALVTLVLMRTPAKRFL